MKKILFCLLFISCGMTTMFAQPGTALNFDGTNDNIRRGLVSNLTAGVTLEARVNWAGNTAADKYIMYNGTAGTNGFGIYLAANSSSFAVKYGAAAYTTTYVLTPGVMTMLSAVVVGANGLMCYANGTLVGSFFPPPAIAPTNSFSIGSDGLGTNNFNGIIDEVRYWNRIVCQAEINHRVNCSPIGVEPLLVAWYNLNQGLAAMNNPTVTTAIDGSPSGYTATLYNFGLTTGTVSNWIAAVGSISSTCTFAPNTVTVSPSGTITICSGSPVTLTATGATSYTWSTAASGSTLALTPTATAQYSVVGASGFCLGMATKNVSVNPLPTVNAASSSPSVLCLPGSATLTASGSATSYTWNPGGTGTSIVVSPTVNTTYTLTGTDANTCQKTTVFTQSVANCTGLVQNNLNLGLSIYPNPNNGEFNVSLNLISESTSFEMYNLIGELVLTQKANNLFEKINISQMPKGIYVLKVKENNAVIATSKFIKE